VADKTKPVKLEQAIAGLVAVYGAPITIFAD